MRLSILSMALLAAIGITGWGQYDPTLKWWVLETDHFYIVFHSGTEGLAQKAALAAEEAYAFLTEELKHIPSSKTVITIADIADRTVGSADPWFNQIRIGTAFARTWLNPRSPSWPQTVVFHEYAHIVDINKISGSGAKFLRGLLGPSITPNLSKPVVFIEGIPAYEKLLMYGESRANNPRDAMYLRMMAVEDQFPSVDEAGFYYSRRQWPHPGIISHNYGPWLMRYIEERYGRGAIAQINEANSQNWTNLLSFGLVNDFNSSVKMALGISWPELYAGFKEWAKEQASAQLRAIAAEDITPSRRLSHLGYLSVRPSWSPEGKWIAYYHYDPDRSPGVRLISPSEAKDRWLIPGAISGGPVWAPSGQALLYVKRDLYKGFYLYGDLYLYDLPTHQEKRLSHGARAYHAAFSPDGQKVLFARYRWGDKNPELAILDLRTKEIQPWKEFPKDYIIQSFAISPDGQKIALSLWRRGGYQDIYLLDASSGDLIPITQDKDADLDPTWSPDQQYIVFSSDRGGIYNLYAYRLVDKAFFRATNVVSGAFEPAVSPDGRQIAFTSYSNAGYDVHLIDFTPQNWTAIELTQGSIPPEEGSVKTVYPVRPYNLASFLSPKQLLLFPIGVVAWGQDILGHHAFALLVGWVGEPFYAVSYSSVLPLRTPTVLSVLLSKINSQEVFGLNLDFSLFTTLLFEQKLHIFYERIKVTAPSEKLGASWSLSWGSEKESSQEETGLTLSGQLLKKEDQGWERQFTLNTYKVIRLLPQAKLTLKLSLGWGETKDSFLIGGGDGDFALRGFAAGVLQGEQALVGSLEYQQILFSIERGLSGWSVFLDDIEGSIFLDIGVAGKSLDFSQPKLALG